MHRWNVIFSLTIVSVVVQFWGLTTSSQQTAYHVKSKLPSHKSFGFGYYENWNYIKTEKERKYCVLVLFVTVRHKIASDAFWQDHNKVR